MIVQSRRMGWTERVARMEELINACKIWIETLERKRLLETSCCMSNIKMDVIQGGSNMTGTDLYVNKPHCAAAVRP